MHLSFCTRNLDYSSQNQVARIRKIESVILSIKIKNRNIFGKYAFESIRIVNDSSH